MLFRRLMLLTVLGASAVCGADALRVMTFNVRYPAKSDGPDVWEARRDILVETIRNNAPDVFGTQELFYEQGQYIVEKLPQYQWFGLSRRGNHEDEHMGVFYRTDRLRVVDNGNFWLSDKPDEPGSMSWNVSLPRMVTWALFEDKRNQQRFYFYDTHFPHRAEDAQARVECARVLSQRLRLLPSESTVIVTGDFNTGAGTEPYQMLTMRLSDAWTAAADHTGPVGTFHGFRGTPGDARIDWILYRGKVAPRSVKVIQDNRGGRYPSDHFPVLTVFEWQE